MDHRIVESYTFSDGMGGRMIWFLCLHPSDRLKMLGWARLELVVDRLWFAVSVEEVHRGGGIGRALLARACAWVDRGGFTLYLTSKPHLVEWYASAGFVAHDPPEDVHPGPGQTFMIRTPQPLTP